MKKINFVKFAVDVIMAVTFVLLFNKRVFGGMTFHEVAGTAIGIAFLTHMALNWKWIKNVTCKLFDKKLPGKTRFSYGLNLLLLLCMATIMVSGIFVSRVLFPNVNIGNVGWFKMLHISLSFLTLIIVGIHVGMHWKWVINVWNKVLSIKEPKSWMNWVSKGAMAVVLVFGLFQIYGTGFMARAASPFSLIGGNAFAAGKGMDRDETEMAVNRLTGRFKMIRTTTQVRTVRDKDRPIRVHSSMTGQHLAVGNTEEGKALASVVMNLAGR